MPLGRTRPGRDEGVTREQLTGLFRVLMNIARLTTVEPTKFDHVSKLPGASISPGRVMYVGGTTKRLYMSDGTRWRQITVV